MPSSRFLIRFFALVLVLGVLCTAVSASARDVCVGIGYVLPPYVIRETNMGLEVEVVRKALAASGYGARFVYLPNLRLPLELAKGSLDAVAANMAYDLGRYSGRRVYRSRETVRFRNYAVSLAGKRLQVNDMWDLAGLRVLAFQNARYYLGPEFGEVAAHLDNYQELADQSLQVGMLYADRADIVISDGRIFRYWRRELAASPHAVSLDLEQPLRFHDIFPPSPRAVFFVDGALRDAFDRGLAAIEKRGVIQALRAKYLGDSRRPDGE